MYNQCQAVAMLATNTHIRTTTRKLTTVCNAHTHKRGFFTYKLFISDKPPKKKKDPNAPKAASNAYMIFCKERRSKLKKENPDLAFGKIGAKLGEIWRALTPEEKRPYEERAASDRERYRKEMENYKNDGETGATAGTSSGANDTSAEPPVRKKRSLEDTTQSPNALNGLEEPADKKAKTEPTAEFPTVCDGWRDFHRVTYFLSDFGLLHCAFERLLNQKRLYL